MFRQPDDFSPLFCQLMDAKPSLSNAEAFLIPILEAIPDPLFVKDQHHRWISVNDAFCELVGQPREKLLGKTDYDFFPTLQADIFWEQDEIAFQQGKAEQEEQLTTTRGQTHFLSTKKTVFTQPDGSQILIGIIRDITTLKQQQAALQDSQTRFERLASNLPGMIYQFHKGQDGSVSILYVSDGCRELLEFEPSEIYQDCQIIFKQIHPDDLPGVLESIEHSAQTLTQWEYEWRNVTPSGQMKWFKGKSRPQQQADGGILWDGVMMDITELKESQNFIQKVAKAIPLVLYLYDLIEQRNIYANRELTAHLGYTTAEIQQMGSEVLAILMHSDDFAQYPAHVERLKQAQDGEVIEWEYRMQHQGGEWRTFWSREVIFSRTPDGQPWRILGLATDITERQRDQMALRISEERLNLALNATQDGLWDWNVATGETYFSSTLKSMLGYVGDEMKPHVNSWEKLLHPDDQSRVITILNEHFKGTSEYYEAEYRMRTKSGNWKWILAQGQVAEWDTLGHPLRMVGTHKDIHDRKTAELALSETAAKLEEAQRLAHIGHWEYDLITQEVKWSAELFRIFGFEGKSVPTFKEHLAMIHPDDQDLFISQVNAAIQEGKPYDVDVRFYRPNGELFYLNARGMAAQDSHNQIVRLFGTALDISDRKRAEIALQKSVEYREVAQREANKSQELEETLKQLKQTQINLIQAEKMSSLGQMVAGVAHEINNPVSFIYGNVEHCREYVSDLLSLIQLYQKYYPTSHPEIQTAIEEIDLDFMIQDLPQLLNSMQVGAERIGDIVKSLRTFSRLDEAEMKAVNLHDNIDSTIRILEHRLKPQPHHPPIQIIREYGNLPLVECYAGQLNQVFMNLLVNAIDAIEEKQQDLTVEEKQKSPDKIYVKTQVEKDQVNIVIRDTGLGIKETVLSRVFDPFYTTKAIGKGTGMGLAISYQIVVEKHCGQLYCHSKWGLGTQFVIKIPISQHQEIA
ncbi:PAS domain-containing sensor histidine kinase [Planktothrix mougeotii]|uniref:histidine kinase n=1 Tax=Planktothrix mougeotii LEGE 06226 TaxID=1828728 RepID=A0ABR9UHK2_9CYAN|nr:PAS domain-containing protein [Planktothrix mougeotii]MBE9145935.1 PAS domain-containing protein [Planktothrix mougeotii LEGE 06226]